MSEKCNPSNPNMSKEYKGNHGESKERFSAIYDTSVKAKKGEDLRQKKANGLKYNELFKKGGKGNGY